MGNHMITDFTRDIDNFFDQFPKVHNLEHILDIYMMRMLNKDD